MVERQDIDALLIGALYGELTPAEEKSLAAHLESHPADRTALDDLTRAREALHQSRILAFQYEPPQSISALLIQEASRRAPKKASEGEGWFARFVRSFMVHPAMAAAAMIVVVVGAATLVSRNTDNQFADTPPVETAKQEESAREVADMPVATGAPAYGFDTTGDQFKVALADEKEAGGEQDEAQASPETDPSVGFYNNAPAKGTAVATNKAPPSDRGLEVRRPEPAPKDFDEAKPVPRPEPKLAKQVAPQREERAKAERSNRLSVAAEGAPADDALRGYADGRASGGGAAPGTAAASPTATAPAAPPPPPRTAAGPRQDIATDGAATSRDAQKSKEKTASDPNLPWAKDQHAALVTAVRANNCGRAASLALAIENRAPGYYASNVATDRSVKQCLAYINNEREKDAALRASRAKRSQLKNAEPSAPKRAADEPARTESIK